MIADLKAVRITGILHRDLTPVITSALAEAGVQQYQVTPGRCIVLRERKGFLGLMTAAKVVDYPADILSLQVPPECEEAVLEVIIQSGALTTPGRGSVFSEDIVIYRAHPLCGLQSARCRASGALKLQKELMGITCIVSRGEGDAVARLALDTGTCVPGITYAEGRGARERLGLLRITIPAEKEVITLVASAYDAETLMNLLITVAKLNQPGKGFVYLYHIRAGQIDMKVIQGMPKHAASMEQIVLAIDEMRGGSSWRARGGFLADEARKRDDYLHDLVSLNFTCNEGRGEPLVKVGVEAGLPGATLTRARHVCQPEAEASRISPAREVCTMVVARPLVEPVVNVMLQHGALDEETHGQFCLSSVPKAYTFIAPN